MTAGFGVTKSPASVRLWLGLLVLTAALLRTIGINERWLWYDELLTANFSVHGVWRALVSVLRFDIHPPLYYLQLSLWALISDSDVWLMANSILWSAAAVGVVGHCAGRLYGTEAGLVAALLLAVAPASLAFSDQVRMYNMLMVLVIIAWYAQARWVEKGAGRSGLIALAVSQLLVVYTHSAGLIILSGPVIFGFVSVYLVNRKDAFVRWLLAEIAVLLLSLPAVAIALFRQVEHTRKPDLADMLSTWTFLITGHADLGLAFVALAVLAAAGLVAIAFYDRRARLIFPTLIAAPMLIAAAMSYALKPVWLERTFLPLVPFISLTFALGLTRPREASAAVGRLRWAGVAAIVVLLSAISIPQQLVRLKGDGFKPMAALIDRTAQPGDVVLVDSHFNLWSLLWYYVGPHWGIPQHTYLMQPKWARAMERVPTSIAGALDLAASTKSVAHHGVTVALWERGTEAPQTSSNVFVLRWASDPPVSLPGLRTLKTSVEKNVALDWMGR